MQLKRSQRTPGSTGFNEKQQRALQLPLPPFLKLNKRSETTVHIDRHSPQT